MASPRITFQKMLPGCERGDRDAWQTFVTNMTPVASSLLAMYVSQIEVGERSHLWQELIRDLAAEGGARLRELDHQGEREFLVDLKKTILEFAADQLPSPQGNTPASSPTLESLPGLLHSLPLAQQEIAILKLAGYSDSTLERMLLAPSSLVQKALTPLAADYAGILGRERDVCPWPAAWLALLRAAGAARGEGCPPRRIFVRILDGQISWYEKTPAEAHMARCLHCLESWSSVREVSFLKSEAKPTPAHEVEALLSFLLPEPGRKTEGSWLGRLLGR